MATTPCMRAMVPGYDNTRPHNVQLCSADADVECEASTRTFYSYVPAERTICHN